MLNQHLVLRGTALQKNKRILKMAASKLLENTFAGLGIRITSLLTACLVLAFAGHNYHLAIYINDVKKFYDVTQLQGECT